MFEYPTEDFIDILYQGACQSDAQSCRYKHRSPMDLDLGNERTTWEDVRAREEVQYHLGEASKKQAHKAR